MGFWGFSKSQILGYFGIFYYSILELYFGSKCEIEKGNCDLKLIPWNMKTENNITIVIFESWNMQKKSCITRYCIKEFINFREIKEFSKFTIFVKETFQVRHQLKFCIICSLKVGLKPKFRSHIFDLKHIELKTFLGVIYLLLKQLSRTWVLLRSENII